MSYLSIVPLGQPPLNSRLALTHNVPRVVVAVIVGVAKEIDLDGFVDVFESASALFDHFRLERLKRKGQAELFGHSVTLLPFQELRSLDKTLSRNYMRA